MKRKMVLVLLSLSIIVGCKNNKEEEIVNKNDYPFKNITQLDSLNRPLSDTIGYFPVNGYKIANYFELFYINEPILSAKYLGHDMIRFSRFVYNPECIIRFVKYDNETQIIIKYVQIIAHKKWPKNISFVEEKYSLGIEIWDTVAALFNKTNAWARDTSSNYFRRFHTDEKEAVIEYHLKDKYGCIMGGLAYKNFNREAYSKLYDFFGNLKKELKK